MRISRRQLCVDIPAILRGSASTLSFYITKNFDNRAAVDHEFRLTKADRNWTPLVVVGPETRKAKGII